MIQCDEKRIENKRDKHVKTIDITDLEKTAKLFHGINNLINMHPQV